MSSPAIKGRISLFKPTPPTTTPSTTSSAIPYLCQPNLYDLFKGYVDVGTLDKSLGVPLRFRRPCSFAFIRFLSAPSPRTCYPELQDNKSNVTEAPDEELAGDEELDAQLEVLQVVAYQHVLPILIAIAILTNLLNVFMLWKVRDRQKQQKRQDAATTYCYLMWLAITDLLASVSLIPSLVHLDRMELFYGWAFYYAHLEIPIMNSLTSSSVYIVVGLSVDRFVAVCFPRQYKSVNAPRMAKLRIAFSLVLPFVIYLPHCFYQEVICAKSGMGWTYQGNSVLSTSIGWHIWEVIVELCHRMVPATILAVLNICIIVTFRKIMSQNKSMLTCKSSSDGCKDDGGRSQRERRLVNLLIAVVTTFLLTNLPAAVLALTDTAGATLGTLSYEVFRAVANCLEMLGFSLNFVLYFFFVNGMKEALLEGLTSLRSKLCCMVSYAAVSNYSSSCSGSKRTYSQAKSTETADL